MADPTPNPCAADRPPPSLAEATRVWARIGCLGFGGPAGQIALMHQEVVEERGWVDEDRFLHALNFCMLLPGPEAQQLATYLGWLMHGTRGGLIAGGLFVLPGFVLLTTLSVLYVEFRSTSWLSGQFFGLKAAVLAIVVQAVIKVGRRALKTPRALVLAIAAFLALAVFAVPFPVVVLVAGAIGAVLGGEGAAVPAAPRSEAGGFGRAGRVIAVWGGVWLVPIVAVAVIFGADSRFLALATYFSQMAVVTFGGAYAVLAAVAQHVVAVDGWLTPGEMLDGLALAETTPGPLILVLTWVGFLAGFRAPGALPPLVGGLLGAVVTTWVTFAPCFLWIFLGAPHVERLRANRWFSAASAAIGAAVVGVIADLALWFALHVLFGAVGTWQVGPVRLAVPVAASFDPRAAVVAALAAAALFGLRFGVARTLAVAAVVGWGLAAWG
ncbi:chromate efflux transporter [Siculibacillus lacustris]|uniref:Chromate efflux transporter n=1 Tax=Siculibacillus lacustris TaxID=1549641 RepID=A0A4V2KTU7_9HYPH|nr:chromate efflux transporter [Siculibacillus lacustris]TBW38760.1 chromate efflux transporter [Siculibacillus lacustris]